MKTSYSRNSIWLLGLIAAVSLIVLPAQANPIPIPERPVTAEISSLMIIAILAEAACWVFLLRKFQRPRFLILWILAMHIVTFPGFLGVLKLLEEIRPATAVVLGESVVVLVEGYFVFLICNYLRWARQGRQPPSLARCWVVSLAANICSMVAFPLATWGHDLVFSR